jgi:hypothetical protein
VNEIVTLSDARNPVSPHRGTGTVWVIAVSSEALPRNSRYGPARLLAVVVCRSAPLSSVSGPPGRRNPDMTILPSWSLVPGTAVLSQGGL